MTFLVPTRMRVGSVVAGLLVPVAAAICMSTGAGAAATIGQQSELPIPLQPTTVATEPSVPSTTSTTTTEASLPTLPTTTAPPTTTPAESGGVSTTTPTTGPAPGPAAFDDPTLVPVCASAVAKADVDSPPTGTTIAPAFRQPALPQPSSACRIIAYYGNPLSTRMGVLGQYPAPEMLRRLAAQTAIWQTADPTTRTRCALELIAVSAQANPGPHGLYRARMLPAVIEKVIGWARSGGCLTILDVQVGGGTVADEVAFLRPWLAQADVHLALDPEWDMPPGVKPGTRIGTMDASDINGAIGVLDELVRTKQLGPKLLTVHRFRDFMVTNPTQIRVPKSVRLVVNMDGFGPPRTKFNSYAVAKAGMPTTLTGFKLFYKNDKPMLTPPDVLPLRPIPMFINYQ
jgi:hypothetical protein